MDYVSVHHMWIPLAAFSFNDNPKHTVTASSIQLRNFYKKLSSLEFHTTPIPNTVNINDVNDVWYKIMFEYDLNNVLNKFNETDFNITALKDNSTLVNGNFDSSNETSHFQDVSWHLVTMIGTAVILGILILATVIGNVFVIAAILLERNLQNVANYLILSLAVADLLVACLVMPFGAVYEVSQEWALGPELCDMWTSSDVLCCTASILHLVAIALDRYWAVTNIDYIHHRTAKRIGLMIVVVWCVAFLVCIAPLLGWKDPDWSTRVENNKCIVSQDISYQVFATSSSFYLPLLVILILYWRIFQTARKRIRRRQATYDTTNNDCKNVATSGIAGGLAVASGTGGIAAAVVTIIGRPIPTISEITTAFTTVSSNSNNSTPEKNSYPNGLEPEPTTTDCGTISYQPQYYNIKRKKDSADSKRERKAAKTLAIITGAFVICWLPFFIMAVLLPVYKDFFKEYIVSLFLWLGYFNSTLNPIIYTIFSPEFRHAFKKILFGRNYARKRHKNFGIQHFQ